jgi:hypothetical protein
MEVGDQGQQVASDRGISGRYLLTAGAANSAV